MDQTATLHGRNLPENQRLPGQERPERPLQTFMGPIGALVHKVWASLHRSAWGQARVEGVAEGIAEHVDRDQHADQGQAGEHGHPPDAGKDQVVA
jgi:hypothetical protein